MNTIGQSYSPKLFMQLLKVIFYGDNGRTENFAAWIKQVSGENFFLKVQLTHSLTHSFYLRHLLFPS